MLPIHVLVVLAFLNESSLKVLPPRDTQLQLTRMAYFAGLASCLNGFDCTTICQTNEFVKWWVWFTRLYLRANLSMKTPQIHHRILPICLPRDVSSSGKQKQCCSFNIVLFHFLYDLLYKHQIWTYRCFWWCSFPSTVHVFTVACTDFHDPSRGRRSFSIIDKRLASSHSLHHSPILHRGQTECCNSRSSAGRQAARGRARS